MSSNSDLNGIVTLTLNTLSSVPGPISNAIINVVRTIWAVVQQASQNRNQIRLLFRRVCQLLLSLKVPQSYEENLLHGPFQQLIHNLETVLEFIRNEQRKSFLRSVFTADDLKLKIDEHERIIVTACLGFQNAALVSTNKQLEDLFALINSQDRRRVAQEAQHTAYMQDISDRLAAMQTAVNYPSFLGTLLETVNADPEQMLTSMRAVLHREKDKLAKEEREFLTAGIERLIEQTGIDSDMAIHSWTVTGLEVERGYLLGGDRTSCARMGTWKNNLTLILELKDAETVQRIIKLWEALRNEFVTTFLGASTFDNPPFILAPYSGTPILEYVHVNADVDILKLAFDIARGLEYIHGLNTPLAHGSLRPANIFVDGYGKATVASVGLKNSDFAQPALDFAFLSQQWLSPELRDHDENSLVPTLEGDIYAYGVIVETLLNSARGFCEEGSIEILLSIVNDCKSPRPEQRPKSASIASRLSSNVSQNLPSLFVAQSTSQAGAKPEEDNWRTVRSFSSVTHSYWSGQDIVYLSTPPIDGREEYPLRKLSFEVKCHDQGAERTTASPRDGTWTWVEMAVCRGPEGKEVNLSQEYPAHYRGHMVAETRNEVVRCPFADSTPRVHRVTFDESHPVVKVIKKGDIIKLYPKAMFPGWEIFMYSAEIQSIAEY